MLVYGITTSIASLPPRGAWIEILPATCKRQREGMSLPPRGAWIEIFCHSAPLQQAIMESLPPRGAWIEIVHIYGDLRNENWSLPPRGAWIEIKLHLHNKPCSGVAPPAGSVD